MAVVDSICQTLAQIAPLALAETWDNVGLLVGDRTRSVQRVMTCLTVSPAVVEEAVSQQVDLIVVHHPLPFKAMQRITSDTIAGSMLLRLIASGIAVYSAHTAFDSASDGINQMWADRLGLESVKPLVMADEENRIGAGRCGRLPQSVTFKALIRQAAESVGATAPRLVGDAEQPVSKIALACGSGGSFLAAAKRCGCDAMITGEATFHTCLEAESLGIGIGLLGHYWSERFAMEQLATRLAAEDGSLKVWPSRAEHDPITPL